MNIVSLPILCLLLAPPASVTVEALPIEPADWKALTRVEVRVMENGGPVVYSGVPLRVVLKGKLPDPITMGALRGLADAVLAVSASDGYQTAVSAAAVAMDSKGERFLLALERDGKPLGNEQGPVRLVVPGDPERVRWVRNVTGVDLVHLPRKERSSPAPTKPE
jgi:DMSO/TMAO reductase YedYZ molybdopterin-dependent catalytic subunit